MKTRIQKHGADNDSQVKAYHFSMSAALDFRVRGRGLGASQAYPDPPNKIARRVLEAEILKLGTFSNY